MNSKPLFPVYPLVCPMKMEGNRFRVWLSIEFFARFLGPVPKVKPLAWDELHFLFYYTFFLLRAICMLPHASDVLYTDLIYGTAHTIRGIIFLGTMLIIRQMTPNVIICPEIALATTYGSDKEINVINQSLLTSIKVVARGIPESCFSLCLISAQLRSGPNTLSYCTNFACDM
ncbi:hypothetical protein VNO78_28644 [Psophocarpus tetragonolobus]|uniref:Uncharacterized protein n=1 Tax=Psophocarpus tetragonolobus TaxID=3891 RepID=A0AAN9WYQ2_PSOTE